MEGSCWLKETWGLEMQRWARAGERTAGTEQTEHTVMGSANQLSGYNAAGRWGAAPLSSGIQNWFLNPNLRPNKSSEDAGEVPELGGRSVTTRTSHCSSARSGTNPSSRSKDSTARSFEPTGKAASSLARRVAIQGWHGPCFFLPPQARGLHCSGLGDLKAWASRLLLLTI